MNDWEHASRWLNSHNPLIIASSGGGGHISAAESLIQQLKQKKNKLLPYHFYQHAARELLSIESLIWLSIYTYHHRWPNYILKNFTSLVFPNPEQLQSEMNLLIAQQEKIQQRHYVDFLLDLQPNGLIFASMFNFYQKLGHAASLKRIVKHQTLLDMIYKPIIKNKIYKMLLQGIQQQKPYDSILSTQALGLPAICEAVSKYNAHRIRLSKEYNTPIPEIYMHQFITDIPNTTAEHYLKPINQVNMLHRKNLILHLLDLSTENYFLEKKHAFKVFRYDPQHNPIVRDEFRRTKQEKNPFCLQIIRSPLDTIFLKPNERLGLIMLSSSNGDTSIEYVKSLVHMKIEHIAILGHPTPSLVKFLSKIEKNKRMKSKVHILGHLNSDQLKDLLKNCHLLILKGGGLSLMEIASFDLKSDTIVFLHKPVDEELHIMESGLVWEDGNTDWFIKYSENQNRHAILSNPRLIEKQYVAHLKNRHQCAS
ncbi:MAG: hypothetical protein EBQ95_04405 [Gammaproteobacteria bacterium]|nr:hypothetical protein [Gammaproteobacteria bacterium]